MGPTLVYNALFLITILSTLIFVEASQAALPAKPNGWIQTRFDGTKGNFTIYVTKQAIATKNEDAGWVLVSGPPDGTIYLYSNKRRNYYPFSVGTRVKRSSSLWLMKAIATSATTLTWHKAYATKMLGHPVQVWRATQNGGPISTSKTVRFNGYEYWEETDIHVRPEVVSLNVEAHGWPNTNGLALRYVRTFLGGNDRAVVDTKSIQTAFIPPATFLVPKGYKLAKSEFDVISNTEGLGEMMNEWQLEDGKAPVGGGHLSR
jgi:hypothetical protein